MRLSTSILRTSFSSFNSRTPGGVRRCVLSTLVFTLVFQFTHPGRGATGLPPPAPQPTKGFNSRTPGGVRHTSKGMNFTRGSFNSRTPGGVRRGRRADVRQGKLRFNSRTPGGVRLRREYASEVRRGVSIHAPREGCDTYYLQQSLSSITVSIHAPREGCDARAL